MKAVTILFAFIFGILLFRVSAAVPPPVGRTGDSRQAETDKLSGVAEVSYIDTRGNTDQKTFVANNTLKYLPTEKITGTWKLNLLVGEADHERTAERYNTHFQLDYKFSKSVYSLGVFNWLRDEFAGVDARYYMGAGLGTHILAGPKHNLSVEGAWTYTVEKLSDGTDDEFPGGRLFAEYEYLFNAKNKFLQTVEWLIDFDDLDNDIIMTETAVISTLNSFLSLKASYLIHHDNKPASNATETDTVLSVALIVNFL